MIDIFEDLKSGFEIRDLGFLNHDVPDDFLNSFDGHIVEKPEDEKNGVLSNWWALETGSGAKIMYAGTVGGFENWKKRLAS